MRGMDEQQTGQRMTLRQLRARRALSLADLAAEAGVTKTTLIAIEHDRVTVIKRKTIRRLAEALKVEPWDVAEFRRALSGEAPTHED
jgi:DNA-binding Xre family transcriptional regulator